MKNTFGYALIAILFFLSCTGKQKPLLVIENSAIGFDFEDLTLAEGLTYEILFQSKDSIFAPNGTLVPSKENLDCNVLIIDDLGEDSVSYSLFTSFETRGYNQVLGSGGGGMISNLYPKDNTYKIKQYPVGVDYSSVGGTLNNCGGKLAPNGKIWSAEEFYTEDSKELFAIFHDTSDFDSKPFTNNFGWIVEIDPKTAQAERKVTAFGRYIHEDALATTDGKSVYLTNDDAPAVLFKFEADQAFDYSKGQLFAYSETRKWIQLPNDYQSLLNCREEAFKRGATLFTRHEWLTLVGDKLYITETGKDTASYKDALVLGGVLPSYYPKDSVIDDPYGRILVLDLNTLELKVELEGGVNGAYHFSNPDCITSYTSNGESFLIISEDINAISRGRSPVDFIQNEVFKYDLQTKLLTRLMVAPKGSETTGCIFDKKGNFFVNIQHPSSSNKSKFNRSTLILVKGIQ